MWGRDATAMISANSDALRLQASGVTNIPSSTPFGQFAYADIDVSMRKGESDDSSTIPFCSTFRYSSPTDRLANLATG